MNSLRDQEFMQRNTENYRQASENNNPYQNQNISKTNQTQEDFKVLTYNPNLVYNYSKTSFVLSLISTILSSFGAFIISFYYLNLIILDINNISFEYWLLFGSAVGLAAPILAVVSLIKLARNHNQQYKFKEAKIMAIVSLCLSGVPVTFCTWFFVAFFFLPWGI